MSDPELYFPHPSLADEEGLLAIGGDLQPDRLLLAYRFGIFPWYNNDQPILWWSPDPRCVLYPGNLRVSKSMRTLLKKISWTATADVEFIQVITQCQKIKRAHQSGTWITQDMLDAYINLHHRGYAHSIEVWDGKRLIGGLYGLSLGKVFFGESMFSLRDNASKYAFVKLVQHLEHQGFTLIDCQQDTPHLRSLGATTIPRSEFLEYLRKNLLEEDLNGSWSDWF